MTSKSINSTILSGKFADILDFLTVEGDEVDSLAQHAIEIIICTDVPQTGEEADTDPFVANMYASAALASLGEIRHYPFIRRVQSDLDPFQSGSMRGSDQEIIASARQMIENAEALLPQVPELPEIFSFDAVTAGGTDLEAGAALLAEILRTSEPDVDALVLIFFSDGADEEPVSAG